MNITKRIVAIFIGFVILADIVIAITNLWLFKYDNEPDISTTKYVEVPSLDVQDYMTRPVVHESTETEPMDEPEQSAATETPEPVITTMYNVANLNVRRLPEIEQSNVITVAPINTEFLVYDYDEHHIWEMVMWEDSVAYVKSEFLSLVPAAQPEPVYSNFKAYGIWTGAYWHFTPEQIDAQWGGYKKSKPFLSEGTTRAWQQYLYEKLAERHIEFFYKYAVAQAMQESGMNPLNNHDFSHISWLKGEATYDCGLYSFKTKYWNPAYGDVFDYHANINAYIDRIYPILATDTSEANIQRAIAQHYDPYKYSQAYVNNVLIRLNELWEQ